MPGAMDSSARILLLGGSGFLGSFLAEEFLALGHHITVFSRHPGRFLAPGKHTRLVAADLGDEDALVREFAVHELVVYLPWSSNPAGSWLHPVEEVEQNVRACVRVFELAAAHGVKKMVFPSSGGTVYGPQAGNATEATPPHPISPYGIGKLTAEHFLAYVRERFGMAGDVYRIGNLIGPRQPADRLQGVAAIWMDAVRKGQALQIFGDQHTIRDYVFVRDAARLMTHSLRDLSHSDTYNLGTGSGVSILDLLATFESVVGVPFDRVFHPRRPCDNDRIVLDSAKLLRHFPGFRFVPLADALRATWQACP